MKDLGGIAGSDLTGTGNSNATIQYTVTLFGYCTSGLASGDVCTRKVGFSFDPVKDLDLGSTSLKDSFNGLSPYQKAAWFLGIGYIMAEILTFFTVILSLFSLPQTLLAGVVTSAIATILLIAASGTSLSIFTKYNGSLNDILSKANIESAVGNKLFIISWIATVTSLICTIVLIINARRTKTRSRRVHHVGLLDENAMDKSGMESQKGIKSGTMAKPGFLAKIPTWNRHKYEQIDDNQALKATTAKNKTRNSDDAEVLIARGFRGSDDEDEEDLARVATRSGPRGIQLQPMGGGLPNRDVDTGYEPYRNHAI